MRHLSTALTAALVLLVVAGARAQTGPRPRPFPGQPPFSAGNATSRVPFIDTHVHLDGQAPNFLDWEGAVQVALTGMDAIGVTRSLVMPPPFPAGLSRAYDHEAFIGAVSGHADRFGFLSGGGSLNGMIQEAVAAGDVSAALRRRFEERAEKILKDGALGFGELTAEHLSFNSRHPYVSVPPDHPLFLTLADIAARHDVPIGEAIRVFLDRLPPDLARKIATDNAVRIYHLAQHQ